jgi:aspartate/methionine/tyrosine aminotransferase
MNSVAPRGPLGLRPAIENLTPQLIREVSLVGQGIPDVIALWFGEPDVTTPKVVRDAAAKALADGETFYNPNRGIEPLRKALAEYHTWLYGRPFDQERFTVTPSGVQAIMQSGQAIIDPGDDVLAVAPLWPNCREIVHIMSGGCRTMMLDFKDGRWSLDVERFLSMVRPNTSLIMVNSPNNPTGWVMSAEEQKAILAFCRKRGIWLLADEVYARLVFSGARAAPSFLEHADPEDRLIVVNSFSKPWAMTGWRVGWLVHPPALGKTFQMLGEYNMSCATTFAQHGAVAALKHGESFVEESVARYRRGRDIVYQRLAANPRVRIGRPDGAFYAFFAVEGLKDSLAAAKDLVRKGHVGLSPGAAFGPECEGYLRLCFAKSAETVTTAIDRIESFIAKEVR